MDFLRELGIEAENPGAYCGEWLDCGGEWLETRSPATGERIARVRMANAADYDRVVDASHAAFLRWRAEPGPRRGEIVRRCGEAMRAKKDALGRLITLEMGKIVQEGWGEVQECIDIADFAVGLSRQLYGLTMPSERPGHVMREQWHPLGGLAITMLWYNAVLTILGFEGGLLLGFIGPVSVIAFGVDFFVHASGRAREQQVAGLTRDQSYPRGLTLVFPALLLAVISSAAAFISNGVAGIQAIVQFGIGTAIALLIGFLILGIIVPRWLLTIEDIVGDPPLDRGLMIRYKLGFVVMSLFAGVAVAMSVGEPIIGFVALAVFTLLFVYLPVRRTRRNYAKAAAAGRPTGTEIKGAGHGFKAAGTVVHFLARWRVLM